MRQRVKRILLLDDDYESMAPLKLFLEEVHGFDVVLSAAATLTKRLQHERFDLICLDLMIHPISLDENNQEVENLHFPNINWQQTGLAFLKRLRAGAFVPQADSETADSAMSATQNGHAKRIGIDEDKAAECEGATSAQVPVIILSAVADRSREESMLHRDKCTTYLEKPFDLEQIIDLIDHYLGGTGHGGSV